MNTSSYIIHVLFHPIDSFWEMKFQRKGKLSTAVLIALVFFFVTLFERQVTAFSFNENYNTPLDIAYQLRIIIIPIFLFCLSNWAITTLMDGKGTMKDIFMVVSYSLVPLSIGKVLTSLLSLFLSLDENTYFYFAEYVGILWFVIILVVGIMTVHQYSFAKTVATFALTAVAASVIIFVVMLFMSLFTELYGFVYTIYRELTLRI